jgi:flagellar M-ring protein FliF
MDKIKESFSKGYVNIKEKWTSIAGRTRTIILAVTGVIVVSAIIITVILNQPEQTVLVTPNTSAEAQRVVAVLAEYDISARVGRNNDVILADSRQLNAARVRVNENRLVSRGQNNDVWNLGVGMFTTETQMTETQKHQSQQWIMDYLESIDEIDQAWVVLNIPKTKNYVMVDNRGQATASVGLTLKPGRTLTRQQIAGITSWVSAAVGIEEDNVSINNGSGVRLIASDGLSLSEELDYEHAKLQMQSDTMKMIANDTKMAAEVFLTPVLGAENFSITVGASLNFSTDGEVSIVEYGDVGVVRDIIERYVAGGIMGEGGVVGTWGNSDIAGAPNYPTLIDIAEGSEAYIEWENRRNYEIDERRTFFKDTGLRIEELTVALVINQIAPLTIAEQNEWQELVAFAVRTTPDRVSVRAHPFPTPPTVGPPERPTPGEAMRDILIWIIIILGVLLIALFMLALLTSGRKKRHIRYRGPVTVADGMGGYLRDDSFQPMPSEPDGFDLPSLLDENETKDVVLKREIKEFSKSNPEIIAQLIRTWFREDEP